MSKYTDEEIRIARTLIESEGPDPEFLSIAESVADLDREMTDAEVDEMCEHIGTLISGAITTITFDFEG